MTDIDIVESTETPSPHAPPNDRLTLAVEKRALEPDSLVGSFFHGTSAQGWQGCVVAEPAPGVYLVETFEWWVGASYTQQLVRIEDMFGWTFYDTNKWMVEHYHHTLSQRWEAERKAKEEA